MGKRPSKCKKTRDSSSGIYKTTVETWGAGPQKITCPWCDTVDRPFIRKQKNKVAYTSLGAICMLSCWPICFLPFLMPEGSIIHLYCKHCGAFLGEYNRKTGKVRYRCTDPNKQANIPSDLC